LVQLAEGVGQAIAPAVAGALLAIAGLGTVIMVDVVTFLTAVTTLLVARFPRPEQSFAGQQGSGSLFREARFGWTYIKERPGLLALLGVLRQCEPGVRIRGCSHLPAHSRFCRRGCDGIGLHAHRHRDGRR